MAKHTVVTIAGKKRYRQRVTIPGRGPKDIYGLTVSELEAKVAAYRAATPLSVGPKSNHRSRILRSAAPTPSENSCTRNICKL